MKKIFTFLACALPALAMAQAPAGYYLPAAGLNGQPLRLALMNIIRTHTPLTYTPGLWNAYNTTDKKASGKLWDIYSDIPGGTPAYEYTLVTDQCGSTTPTAEHACYNREHTWPQSKFNALGNKTSTAMYTDLFIVYPTDNYVNGQRGDLPYGKVGTATKTFTNGSKIGNNTYAGAPAGSCFEPIDSFKGDVARNYFYVSTCYRNDSANFTVWEMASQVNLTPWTIQMLLEWHHNDPVSKKETDRNNAAYTLQGNRNPFIDHPEYADCIWGSGNCATTYTTQTATPSFAMSLYPNPAAGDVTLEWAQPAGAEQATVKVSNISGQVVYTREVAAAQVNKMSIATTGWAKGIYFVQLLNSTNVATQRLIVE